MHISLIASKTIGYGILYCNIMMRINGNRKGRKKIKRKTSTNEGLIPRDVPRERENSVIAVLCTCIP